MAHIACTQEIVRPTWGPPAARPAAPARSPSAVTMAGLACRGRAGCAASDASPRASPRPPPDRRGTSGARRRGRVATSTLMCAAARARWQRMCMFMCGRSVLRNTRPPSSGRGAAASDEHGSAFGSCALEAMTCNGGPKHSLECGSRGPAREGAQCAKRTRCPACTENFSVLHSRTPPQILLANTRCLRLFAVVREAGRAGKAFANTRVRERVRVRVGSRGCFGEQNLE